MYAPALDEDALTSRENSIYMRLQPQSQCFGNELKEWIRLIGLKPPTSSAPFFWGEEDNISSVDERQAIATKSVENIGRLEDITFYYVPACL